MDPVTMIGLVAVAAMFTTGVLLVWVGLRRRPDRLPSGADAVLSAVLAGQLRRPDHAVDLVHPPTNPPRATQPTPAVRLLPKREAEAAAHEPPTEIVRVHQTDPGPAVPVAVTIEEPDEPVVAVPVADGPAAAVTPDERVGEPVASISDEKAEKAEKAEKPARADLTEALFEGIDDPSTPESAFFATKPQLQRF
jgi:hypothetical protein